MNTVALMEASPLHEDDEQEKLGTGWRYIAKRIAAHIGVFMICVLSALGLADVAFRVVWYLTFGVWLNY